MDIKNTIISFVVVILVAVSLTLFFGENGFVYGMFGGILILMGAAGFQEGKKTAKQVEKKRKIFSFSKTDKIILVLVAVALIVTFIFLSLWLV